MPAGSWLRWAEMHLVGSPAAQSAGAVLAVPAVLALLGALAGCGSSAAPDDPTAARSGAAAPVASAASSSSAARPPTGVRPAAPAHPSTRGSAKPAAAPASAACATAQSGSYTTSGVTYLLSVPTGAVTSARPLPLVLSYHGYQQSAAAQEAYTGLGAYAAGHGAVVATLQGAGGQWNFPRSAALRDDLAASRAVVADVRSRLCGRVSGVGATGWSDGADMANLVACTGIARAVVGVAPSITPRGCSSWPPMTEVHGTADPFVPYGGGGGSRGGAFTGTEAQPAPARVAAWARSAGCGSSRSYRVGADVGAQRWDGCDVRLYTVEGGGHTWPSRPGRDPVPGLGRTSTTLDADALVVDILSGRAG